MLYKHKAVCPVCKAYLGEKYKDELYMAHCDECKTTFTWHRNDTEPTALLDKNKPKRCGCEGCGR